MTPIIIKTEHSKIFNLNIVNMVRIGEKKRMLTYSFDDLRSESLYLYLYKCIKNDILDGKVKAGEKLPSKRSFAKNLGISTITVENAYAQLLAEGYIYSLPKKGYYASDISEKAVFPANVPTNPENFTIAANPAYRFDFVSNRNSAANFPFSTWTKLMRETISEKKEELMTGAPSGGILELRAAICRHMKQFRNMDVSPEQVIVGAGTEYLYGLIIQLLGREKIYAVENPGYDKIVKIYESNGVKCKYINMDESGILVSGLEESHAQIAHISPSHHYPTGIVTPVSRRYELLGWAARSEERYIIEDDYDSEFRLTGKPMATLQSIDVSGKVIYMNTFTKSLASTIRISYMVLPPRLLERFYDKLGFYSCTVSNFEQYTLASFINGGYFEKHINRMRKFYKSVRDKLLGEIRRDSMAGRIEIKEEDAGLHFLMKLQTGLSDEAFLQRASQNGIRLSCLAQYYFGEPPEKTEHTVIMNYSGLSADEIEEAVACLRQCM